MTVAQILLWLVSACVALFGLILTLVVPVGWVLANRRNIIRRLKRNCSWTWPLGGIFGGLAVLAMPICTLSERLAWCWLPLAVESLLYLAGFAVLRHIAYHAYRMDNHANGAKE